jgi:integrase
MLTGQRRTEIGSLRWSEIDLTGKMIRLPGKRVKNGRDHDVPLSAPAIALLQKRLRRIGLTDFVLGTTSRIDFHTPKKGLDARINTARAARAVAPMPHWIIHDLRRSVATHMANRLDTDPHIIEAVLNHVSGHKKGVAGVYNKAPYDRQKREALDLWADYLTAAIDGRMSSAARLRA